MNFCPKPGRGPYQKPKVIPDIESGKGIMHIKNKGGDHRNLPRGASDLGWTHLPPVLFDSENSFASLKVPVITAIIKERLCASQWAWNRGGENSLYPLSLG
jgi:hypothetical protein